MITGSITLIQRWATNFQSLHVNAHLGHMHDNTIRHLVMWMAKSARENGGYYPDNNERQDAARN